MRIRRTVTGSRLRHAGLDGHAIFVRTVGSVGIAAFVGFWIFWILLPYGYAIGELSPKQIATFLILWIGGRVGLGYLGVPALFDPFVAALDIALVFVIFKGDVPLT
jgi:hypothetical protein